MSQPTDQNDSGWGQAPHYSPPGTGSTPPTSTGPTPPTGTGSTPPTSIGPTPQLSGNTGPTPPTPWTPPVAPPAVPRNQTWVPVEPTQTPPPPPQPPQYGQYSPTPPPPSSPGSGYGPPNSGSAPPPMADFKPGIIPLRPLGLGDIWDGAFRAIRYNPAVMFGLTALVETVFGIISAVISARTFGSANSLLADLLAESNSETTNTTLTFDLVGGIPGLLIGSLILAGLSYLATTILTGLLTFAVSRAVIGQKVTISQAWTEVAGQIGRLLLLSLTVVLIIVVAVAVPFVLIVLAAIIGSNLLTGLMTLIMVPTMLVLVTFGMVKLSLATPTLVLERASVGQSLRRSWRLTKGGFWRLFGIIVLTAVVVVMASGTVSGGIGGVVGLITTAPIVTLIATTIATIATSTLFTPFQAGVTALLYIDRRIRLEGLDIELTRAAEG